MIKVYCDNGGYHPELKEYEIELVMFPYENLNKKIKNRGMPTEMNVGEMIHPIAIYTQPIAEHKKTEKFDILLNLIGRENRKDVQHLDSAYKSKCKVFVTSDKKDIWKNRDKVKAITGMIVLHTSEDVVLIIKSMLNK